MGLKIDRKSDEAKALLTNLMDWLETQKRALSDNEAITHELAAQAHIENYALKLFVYADSQDRAANFGKQVLLPNALLQGRAMLFNMRWYFIMFHYVGDIH
jgi:vacuolar protein sorting-associated protein VTA1